MSEAVTTEAAKEESPEPAAGSGHQRRLMQLMVLTAIVASITIFWGAGRLLHIPAHPDYEASLLQQPGVFGKVIAIVAVAILFPACVVVGQLIAGRRWVLAGLFAACVGLCAFSTAGGPSRYVYMHAQSHGTGPAVFIRLLFELILLFAIVGGVWRLLGERLDKLLAAYPDLIKPKPAPGAGGIAQVVAVQTIIMGLAMLLFSQTDDKKCALISTFLAGFIGTSLAGFTLNKIRAVLAALNGKSSGDPELDYSKAGRWYWIGPLLVGAIGYIAYLVAGDPDALFTGRLNGTLAALARPLPLDYASMGAAGALIGYWIGAEHPELAAGMLLLNPHVILRWAQRVEAEKQAAQERASPQETPTH